MKISVIVPVYNTEDYLERCLNSLITQTIQDIEIICVNDGSSDGSLNILKEFEHKDTRIKVVNQPNLGVSSARNNAMKIAQGEYIGFVDSDDWVEKNFYEKLYNAAITYKCDIACGEIFRHTENGYIPLFRVKKLKLYKKTTDKYQACNIPRMCYTTNKIYKRELLLKYDCYFVIGRTFEDITWTHITIDKLGKLITVPKVIYYYECNPNSITESFNSVQQKDLELANKECIDYLRQKGLKVNYKKYTAQEKIRFKLFGIELIEIKKWKHLIIFFILGIPICKIKFEKNF